MRILFDTPICLEEKPAKPNSSYNLQASNIFRRLGILSFKYQSLEGLILFFDLGICFTIEAMAK